MKPNRPKAPVLALLASLGATACGGTSSTSNNPDQVGPPPVTGQAAAALLRADDCDDLLNKIQADMLSHLDVYAEQLLDPNQAYGVPVPLGIARGGVATADGSAVGPAAQGSAPVSPMAPAPEPTSAPTGEPGAAEGADPSGYSDTNTQVAGVDEADIVKTDGQRIYLLHGNQLFILKAWPAAEMAMQVSTKIEGEPLEMFVRGDVALVFSNVYSEALTRGAGDERDAYYGYGYWPYTKVTALDVSADTPEVLREHYIEGNYLSARLNSDIARVVVQEGFKTPEFHASIDYYDPWGKPYPEEEIAQQVDAWKERTANAILASGLEDWLPRELTKDNGELVAVSPRCSDHYAPAPGLVQPGVTTILSLDMSDVTTAPSGATILGRSENVYANQGVLLLSHNDFRFWARGIDEERTGLHRFELDGSDTLYVASGFAPGHIHDQFSLDEQGGVIRVSTTQNRWDSAAGEFLGPVNGVYTLGVDDDRLKVLGKVENLAPGEQIFSTRFVGDRGYVVTFRQVDPLFIVDLSDPTDLSVLAELKIPGFSDYMHPLGDSHLLTIGRDADAEGRDLGLALQIFDVSDAENPQQTHKYVFQENGYSEANFNHKAFTYYADKNLLGFPFTSYENGFSSTLEIFSVDTAAGFERLGGIDHTTLLIDKCETYEYSDGVNVIQEVYCPFGDQVRRGLFIDDYVYSISYGGVMTHALDDLVQSVAEVPLPPPEFYYGDGVGVATPGSPPIGIAEPSEPMVDPAPVPPSGAAPAPAPEPADDTSAPTPAADAGAPE